MARPGVVYSRSPDRGQAVRLEGRGQQQCGRGLHPRPAQEAGQRGDRDRARPGLHDARAMTAPRRSRRRHSLRRRLLVSVMARHPARRAVPGRIGLPRRAGAGRHLVRLPPAADGQQPARRPGTARLPAAGQRRPRRTDYVIQIWSADGTPCVPVQPRRAAAARRAGFRRRDPERHALPRVFGADAAADDTDRAEHGRPAVARPRAGGARGAADGR